MKKGKRGFTLIEVAIFLAVTGALFIGVTVGVQNSIYQQRVNDSIQSFAEFLRGVYAQVLNVQNSVGTGGGRSEQAIYGKMITFGEEYDLAGEKVNASGDETSQAFVYTVVGRVLKESDDTSGDALDILSRLGMSVARVEESGTNKDVEYAGLVESYTPRWAAGIEPPCGRWNCDNSYGKTLKGTVLIVRHPSSGVVYTYYAENEAVNVNERVKELSANAKVNGEIGEVGLFSWQEVGADGTKINHTGWANASDFKLDAVDFCINPEQSASLRHNVRIENNAKNASSVVIVSDDMSKCVPWGDA